MALCAPFFVHTAVAHSLALSCTPNVGGTICTTAVRRYTLGITWYRHDDGETLTPQNTIRL